MVALNDKQPVKAVPEPTLKRLPLYLRLVRELSTAGRTAVSCTEIGAELRLDPTQVRKDLEAAGIAGRPKIGYLVANIVEGIEEFLGWKNVNEAFLVGAGNMGSALLGYRKFEECGLKIIAAFDQDPLKVGTQIQGKHVLALEKLPGLAKRMHILLGVLTVPAPVAQKTAELMIQGGIRAIWNFAPVRLRLPENIIIHNEDLYCSFASLSQKLARELRAGVGAPARPVTPTLNIRK